jgi:hypothetical protein
VRFSVRSARGTGADASRALPASYAASDGVWAGRRSGSPQLISADNLARPASNHVPKAWSRAAHGAYPLRDGEAREAQIDGAEFVGSPSMAVDRRREPYGDSGSLPAGPDQTRVLGTVAIRPLMSRCGHMDNGRHERS